MGVWSKGNNDFKIRHGITCTSCYFPESVFYRAMGRSILSLHYILLLIPYTRKMVPIAWRASPLLVFCIYIRRLEVSKNNRNVKEETEQTY